MAGGQKVCPRKPNLQLMPLKLYIVKEH